MEQRKDSTPTPLLRELARELTAEEVERVSGGTVITEPGTYSGDNELDGDLYYDR